MKQDKRQPETHRTRGAVWQSIRALPPSIWALGMVSMLMDTSSELIFSLLPVYMVSVLGAGMVTVGVIEGVSEATASITRIFSGALSDRLGKRKALTVVGYGLAALTKPVFPLATSIRWVFAARFVDRMGKGIRGAPRDALVADIAAPELRGAAYGLRQSLDSVGALLGPALALGLMAVMADNIRAVLWVAVFPAAAAVTVLVFAVREPPAKHPIGSPPRLTLANAKLLRLRYWLVVVLGAVFTLARFSEAFLVLRARSVGLGAGAVPLVMVVMNVVYAASAYPAGAAADRVSARTLLFFGLALLVFADLVLAWATASWLVLVGAAIWGLHMGCTQGLFSKLVADNAPAELRGTAFGIFSLVTGVALLLASVLAGSLWESVGPAATFLAGAVFAALAAAGILGYRPRSHSP
jgi:MFS family permease